MPPIRSSLIRARTSGEARCEKCHAAIFRDSLASRHTQTYFRGDQLDAIPLPDGPLPDPDDPQVTHTFQRRDGVLHEETRVGATSSTRSSNTPSAQATDT